jgi:hypothetical protein
MDHAHQAHIAQMRTEEIASKDGGVTLFHDKDGFLLRLQAEDLETPTLTRFLAYALERGDFVWEHSDAFYVSMKYLGDGLGDDEEVLGDLDKLLFESERQKLVNGTMSNLRRILAKISNDGTGVVRMYAMRMLDKLDALDWPSPARFTWGDVRTVVGDFRQNGALVAFAEWVADENYQYSWEQKQTVARLMAVCVVILG